MHGFVRGARGNSRPYREMSGDYASQAPVRPTLQFSADKEILNAGIAYRYLAFFRFELWENDICGNKTLSTDRLLASVTLIDQPRQSISSRDTIL